MAKTALVTSRGLCRDIKGRALIGCAIRTSVARCHHSFRGDSWTKIHKQDRKRYLLNAYRVLLHARPSGNRRIRVAG
jgi:hypothetical protein